MAAAKYRRVNVQAGPDPTGTGGPLSRTIPSLQRLCGDRYPEPLRYGQPLEPSRVKRLGEYVRLGSGANAPRARVVGSTTPPRPTLAQLNRGSPSLCDRGYLVETDGGVRLSVNARQVREAMRKPREGLCPFHGVASGYELGAVVNEAKRLPPGTHPRDVYTDLPFPHRRGSSPCCAAAEATPESVLSLLEAWRSGDGFDSWSSADVLAFARRAVARTSAVTPPRSLEDIPRAMSEVRDSCWRQWLERAELAAESKVEKFKRLKGEVRAKYAPPKRAAGSRKRRAA